jgi:hypothetical protein
MHALRRVLYLHAGVLALAGAALAVAPRLVLITWFDQSPFELTWARLAGVLAVGLAMLMVLVGHNVDDVWWWSWAFAFADLSMAGATVLNLAFGLAPRQPAALWWVLSIGSIVLTVGMLYGLYAASRERPFPLEGGEHDH